MNMRIKIPIIVSLLCVLLFIVGGLFHSQRLFGQQVGEKIKDAMIHGYVLDDSGNTVPSQIMYLIEPTIPVLTIVDSVRTDIAGYYAFQTYPGSFWVSSYRIEERRLLDFHALNWTNVSSGDTVNLHPDARVGTCLKIGKVQINGSGSNVSVEAEEWIDVHLTYHTWCRLPVPKMDIQLAVGLEEKAFHAHPIGMTGTYPAYCR